MPIDADLLALNLPQQGDFDARLRVGAAEAFNKAYAAFVEDFGDKNVLVSAYRDEARNTRAGGSKTSRHLHGDAVDIDRSALDQFRPYLEAVGFRNTVKSYKNPKTGKVQDESNHFVFKPQKRQVPKVKDAIKRVNESHKPGVLEALGQGVGFGANPTNVRFPETAQTNPIPFNIGNILGLLGSVGVAGAAGTALGGPAGTLAGISAAGGLQAGRFDVARQVAEGKTEINPVSAAAQGLFGAATAPLPFAPSKLGPAARGAIGALSGGATGAAGPIVEKATDPDSQVTGEDILRSAAIGGSIGALGGAFLTGAPKSVKGVPKETLAESPMPTREPLALPGMVEEQLPGGGVRIRPTQPVEQPGVKPPEVLARVAEGELAEQPQFAKVFPKKPTKKQQIDLIQESGNPDLQIVKKGNLWVAADNADAVPVPKFTKGTKVDINGRQGIVTGRAGGSVGVKFSDTGVTDIFPIEVVPGLDTPTTTSVPTPPQIAGTALDNRVKSAGFKTFQEARDAVLEFEGKRSANDLSEGDALRFKATRALDEDTRRVLKAPYDPETGLFMQRLGKDARQLDSVVSTKLKEAGVSSRVIRQVDNALKNGEQVELAYLANKTGETSSVSAGRETKLVSPTHYVVHGKGHVSLVGYNPDGRITTYNFSDGGSKVVAARATGTPALRGDIANVYAGPQSFDPTPLVQKAPRTVGIKSTDLQIQAKALANVIEQFPSAPEVDDAVRLLSTDSAGKTPSVKNFRLAVQRVKSNKKLRAAFERELGGRC